MENENNYQNNYQNLNGDYEQQFMPQIQNSPNNNLPPNPPANKPNKRIVFGIIFIVAIVFIIITCLIVGLTLSNRKETTVTGDRNETVDDNFFQANSSMIEVLVAPTSATITIDGKEYTNGEYVLAPGQYEVAIKATGFETYNGSVVVTDNHKSFVSVCLVPNSESGNYYETHAEDSTICQSAEELADASAWDQNALLDDIFEYTPFHNDSNGYYVDPYYDDTGKLIVKLTFKDCEAKAETLRDRAYTWMREQNLNPDKYTFEETQDCED